MIHRHNIWRSAIRGATIAVLVVNWGSVCLAANTVEGFTEPYREIDVAAGEMGTIASIEVKEGERVRVGQILARLDEDVLLASLETIRAEVESKGRLESAIAELQLQTDLLTKLEELRVQKHASQQEVDRAAAQKAVAEARVKTVREELHIKQCELRRIEAQLKQRRLSSPIAGVVTRIHKDQGEFVSPSDPVAMKVVQLDPLLVVFSVPFETARRFSADGNVRVRIDSANTEADGVVEFVSPTADPQSGTTRIRVRIPNPEEKLIAGIPCRLLIPNEPTKVTERRQTDSAGVRN